MAGHAERRCDAQRSGEEDYCGWSGSGPAAGEHSRCFLSHSHAHDPSFFVAQFSSTFPRKQFADKSQTLRALGLVPNAALEAANAA